LADQTGQSRWTAFRERLKRPFPLWRGWLTETAPLLLFTIGGIIAMAMMNPTPAGREFALQTALACFTASASLRIGMAVLVDDQNWTVGRAILFYMAHVCLIAIAILIVLAARAMVVMTPAFLLQTIALTAMGASVPIILDVFLSENHQLRRSVRELAEFQHGLAARKPVSEQTNVSEATARITPENGTPRTLSASTLIYVRSRQNYCEICLGVSGQLARTELLRLPMRAFLEQTASLGLLQTHRSWAINPQRVTQTAGNAQGYLLTLDGSEEKVPVSRRFAADVLESLSKTMTIQ
jgi:DNA-binding LytR/AlgR family response regulator